MQIYLSPKIIGIHISEVNAAEHCHHALQLFFSLKKTPFNLNAQGVRLSSQAAAIAPNTPHRLAATNCLSFLLEPESLLAKNIRKHWMSKQNIAELGNDLAQKAYSIFRDVSLTRKSLATFFSALMPAQNARHHLDSRIQRVLAWIDEQMATGTCSDITIEGALNIAFLSKGRFLHLFSEQLGIPWRRYLLWRRLLVVFTYAAGGHSLTDCAHFAAFSDSAHFSKTFKSMFGTSPVTIIKNSQFIQVV